ncbi:MAG: Trm112 family protein [Planctomycetes bacterium]|nr:Trm112 family protein [Planctomycetota bacterium]
MGALEDLLEFVVCPENHKALSLAPPELLARVNAAIEAGKARTQAGETVSERIEAGFLREDGAVLYPVRDAIPNFHIPERLEMTSVP